MIHVITAASDVRELNLSRPNPTHTTSGVRKIRSLLKRIDVYHLIVMGTGARHTEIACLALDHCKPNTAALHYSLLCGEAELFQGDGQMVLASGVHINIIHYFGLNSDYVHLDVDRFLESLADHTLLCADQQMFALLGLTGVSKPGVHLYTIDRKGKSIQLIA